MTQSEIAKLILGIILFLEAIGFTITYKLKKIPKLESYFYLLSTLSLLCIFSFLCFDNKLFIASLQAKYYYIQLVIYLSIQLFSCLIMFIVKKIIDNKKNKE